MTASALARVACPIRETAASPTLHVLGAGPIGRALLQALADGPFRVVAVSDTSGTLFDRGGLDARALADHKASRSRYADRGGAADVPLASLLFHGAADVVVDCTASDPASGVEAVDRSIAALAGGSSVVFAAKHALATDPLRFYEPGTLDRIGFNAVLGGTGLALQDEIESLRGEVESVAIVGNATTTAVIGAIEEGATREEAIDRARRAGYLEADPAADLDGRDAAIKLAIVASLISGSISSVDEVSRVGAGELDPEILRSRRRRGRTTRLVGRLREDGSLSVAYEEVPRVSSLAVPAGRVAYLYRRRDGTARVHIGGGVGTDGTVRAILADLEALVARTSRR